MTKKAQSNPSTAANNKASITGGPDRELPWRIEMMPVEQMRPSKGLLHTPVSKTLMTTMERDVLLTAIAKARCNPGELAVPNWT
jgi:hypothetical protein